VSFSVSDLDPDSIGSAEPDPGRLTFTLKTEKMKNCHVCLMCLNVLYKGFKKTYKKVFDIILKIWS
jgi:hypothetical protein